MRRPYGEILCDTGFVGAGSDPPLPPAACRCRIETHRFIAIGERAIGIARGDMRRAPVAIEPGQRAALRARRGDQPIASRDRIRSCGALACGCIIGRGRRSLCLGQEREGGDELNEAGHENLTKLQKLAIKIAT
jgi:hypothetical protein